MGKLRINRSAVILVILFSFSAAQPESGRTRGLVPDLGELVRPISGFNSGINVRRNVLWAKVGIERLYLDAFWPRVEGSYPIIVNIHGGGWTFGSKEMDEGLCRYLAKRGFVIFNINYRLAPVHRFPAQVNDCLGAVIWAKDHGRDYQGDPNLVAVMGDSAGANLSAMVAFASDYAGFEPSYNSAGRDASVKAGVLIYGVYDLTRFDSMDDPNIAYVMSYLRGPQTLFPERYLKASPVSYLSPEKTPAILILAGENDRYLPDSLEFKQRLDQTGIKCRFYPVENAEHGFINAGFSRPAQEAFLVIGDFLDQELKGKKP